MATPKTLRGWHWIAQNRRLQFLSHTVVKRGQVLTAKGELALCRNGLHASVLALDALQYAPGTIVCRVELSGEIVTGDDKACASRRKCLWWADATRTLHEFACWCATQALEAERAVGRESHETCWKAVETKLRWLRGEATNEELDAARSAAALSAAAAAWSAAARSAAAAARSAAALSAAAAARSAAALSAAAAAWSAGAWSAAAAARSAQNERLEAMLLALAPQE